MGLIGFIVFVGFMGMVGFKLASHSGRRVLVRCLLLEVWARKLGGPPHLVIVV